MSKKKEAQGGSDVALALDADNATQDVVEPYKPYIKIITAGIIASMTLPKGYRVQIGDIVWYFENNFRQELQGPRAAVVNYIHPLTEGQVYPVLELLSFPPGGVTPLQKRPYAELPTHGHWSFKPGR